MGVTIERTTNISLIEKILTNEVIFNEISEDGTDESDLHTNPFENIFLLIKDDELIIGVYILHAFNNATLQIHANLLPEYREKYATISGKIVIEWFNKEAPEKFCKMIALIPDIYSNVYHFTKNRGFNDQGLITKAYRKNGKLHNINILGYVRKEV